jgi:hypothetical protein
MILIQAPGNFLVVLFQIQAHANVSTWLPFLVSGIEQLVLLGEIIWYDYILRRFMHKVPMHLQTEVVLEDDLTAGDERNDGRLLADYLTE